MTKRFATLVSTLLVGTASIGTAHGQSLSDADAALLREEVSLLRARIDELEKRLNHLPIPSSDNAAVASGHNLGSSGTSGNPASASSSGQAAEGTKIQWKGSPQFSQDDRSFKFKGRVQMDANYIFKPEGMKTEGLGFSTEFRRIRLGGEGKLGSGFGYKLEAELSDNSVELVDTFITYSKDKWLFTAGNHNQFQSLDELTGDTGGTVMERAAFTEAFGFERRLGLSAQYRTKQFVAQFGVFTDDLNELTSVSNDEKNDSYSIDGRVVYSPVLGDYKLHFGASAHWREMGSIAGENTRYRHRPYLHSTDVRLLNTGELDLTSEFSRGLEFAAIKGPWHVASEVHWLRAKQRDASALSFWGGYAEVGYFLTKGDTRTFDYGMFGTPKPAHPLSDGGIGSVQLTFRYDYLDLNDGSIRGGKQTGYIAALIWNPIQYLRFNINAGHIHYTDGIWRDMNDIVSRRNYGANFIGTRVELDF